MMTVCSDCGTPFEPDGSRGQCDECRPPARMTARYQRERARGTRQELGYDEAWIRLSKRARRLQPFCSDCGSPDDLTADHSAEAWARKAAGKSIRLRDIDVVCRQCNSDRGAARGAGATDEHRGPDAGGQILEVNVSRETFETLGE